MSQFNNQLDPKYTLKNIDEYIASSSNEFVANRLKSIKTALILDIKRKKEKNESKRKK